MKRNIFILIVYGAFIGCTDPYKLQTNTFDEALVVEATITNEMKRQEIKISKTYRLEEEGPSPVSGATVVVSDDAGNNYGFSQENGIYISDIPFEAIPDRQYRLDIATNDGRSYSSKPEKLTPVSPITSVTASVQTIKGETGIQITASTNDSEGEAKYYRYRYEETFKVIAPQWVGVYAAIPPPAGSDELFSYIPWPYDAETCYQSNVSDAIIVANTAGLSEDNLQHFPIRFIGENDYIIANRYSIIVSQYVQNFESYTYYKLLAEMAGEGHLLSQHQPGFFAGNITSDSNPGEKVIGYFEVSSFSQQRIFFNYDEFFPGQLPPPYFMNCNPIEIGPELPGGYALMISAITSGTALYVDHSGGIYHIVPRECGDCTSFASNVVPTFWVD